MDNDASESVHELGDVYRIGGCMPWKGRDGVRGMSSPTYSPVYQ